MVSSPRSAGREDGPVHDRQIGVQVDARQLLTKVDPLARLRHVVGLLGGQQALRGPILDRASQRRLEGFKRVQSGQIRQSEILVVADPLDHVAVPDTMEIASPSKETHLD